MNVYYAITLLTISILFFWKCKTEKSLLKRTIIALIPLFLFGALRYNFGLDYNAYLTFFEGVKHTDDIFEVNEHMEKGFTVLNKLLPSFRSLMLLTSALMCCSYGFLLYKFVPARMHYIAMFLILLNTPVMVYFILSSTRNGLAIGIFILSYFLIVKRKWLWIAVCAAIGGSIHSSILVVYIIALVVNNNLIFSKSKAILWISVVGFLGVTSLGSIISRIVPIITILFGRYEDFLVEAGNIADNRGYISALFAVIATCIYVYYLLQKYQNKKIELYNYFCLLSLFTLSIGVLGGRLMMYFAPFLVVGLCNMVVIWKNPLKYIMLSMIILMFYLSYRNWTSSDYFAYQKYESCIGK